MCTIRTAKLQSNYWRNDCTRLGGIQPNGWCKMLHCLATCLIICGRELTEASSEGCQEECHVCACVYTCLWLWVYGMLWKARCQMVTDCPRPVKGEGRGVCMCVWLVGCREWGGGQLLALWRAYLWILIDSPLCYSLSLWLTHCSIGGQSSNPLNSVPKENMNKRSKDN